MRRHLYRAIHLRTYSQLARLYRTLAAHKQLADFVADVVLSLEYRPTMESAIVTREILLAINSDKDPTRAVPLRDLMKDLLSGFFTTTTRVVNLKIVGKPLADSSIISQAFPDFCSRPSELSLWKRKATHHPQAHRHPWNRAHIRSHNIKDDSGCIQPRQPGVAYSAWWQCALARTDHQGERRTQ